MKPEIPIILGLDLKVTEIAKNQEEYFTLPVFRYEDSHGTILIRWQLTIWERLRLLITGNLYHIVLTFNKPLQPIKLMCGKLDADEQEYLESILERNK